MASSRLLLLLLGLFSSHPPEVQARPTTFWCNQQERKRMEERTFEELKKGMADCTDSDALPCRVQLPSLKTRFSDWEKKTLQQKCAEVLGALQLLQDGLRMASNQTTSQCQSSLLKNFEHYITNDQLRVKQIQLQNDTVVLSEITVHTNTNSLDKVLQHYKRLVTFTLERFAVSIKDIICEA